MDKIIRKYDLINGLFIVIIELFITMLYVIWIAITQNTQSDILYKDAKCLYIWWNEFKDIIIASAIVTVMFIRITSKISALRFCHKAIP